MPTTFGTTPVTPEMKSVGLGWSDVKVFAEKAIKLIEEQGTTFLDMIDNGFKAFASVTQRDMIGVFTALNAAAVDLSKIISAIREEFGL